MQVDWIVTTGPKRDGTTVGAGGLLTNEGFPGRSPQGMSPVLQLRATVSATF